ncbi:hypothetical protein ACET3X_004332 [Alternaria dauci]|uniref:Uncharacterized protein n=1 Tax=Alternaria dauci TaxID=48095 RepID=A0ABR3UML3_9PLEO
MVEETVGHGDYREHPAARSLVLDIPNKATATYSNRQQPTVKLTISLPPINHTQISPGHCPAVKTFSNLLSSIHNPFAGRRTSPSGAASDLDFRN